LRIERRAFKSKTKDKSKKTKVKSKKMKTRTTQLIAILVLALVLMPFDSSAQGKKKKTKEPKASKSQIVKIFNGKDLSNWVFYLKDQAVDPATVFTVQNGVIHISGNPFGYMRTKEVYSDYKLHVEYRWRATT
jgi:hypothetical protein